MELRIEDLLKQFKGFTILSGESGIKNKVKMVSVMDAPDIYEWMKGGEFLITSGFSFKEDPNYLLKLLLELKARNVAGLGIKMTRYLNGLPKKVKKLSDELDFPIINIPYSYAFTDIINPILSNIVNEQAEELYDSERIHEIFTKITINGEGIESILFKLKDILNMDIYFNNIEFEEEYIGDIKDDIFLERVQSLKLSELKEIYQYQLVEANNYLYGYLILNKNISEKMSYIDKRTLQHASTVLNLEIQKKISAREIEERYRDEFIQDLIFNNIKTKDEVVKRALNYGWDMDNGLVALIVDIDEYKNKIIKDSNIEELTKHRKQIYNISRKIISNKFLKSYYTLYSDIIVFLIDPSKIEGNDYIKYIKKVSKEIKDSVEKKSSLTVSIGIGSYQKDVIYVSKSFQEAQKSVIIGRKIYGNNKIHIYKDLGIYKVLYELSLSKEGNEFYNKYLKELVNNDIRYGTEYMRTIYTIVENDWNLKKTSKDLYVHYNTVLYRFNKICDIQKDNFESRDSKFKMELALRLMDISSSSTLSLSNKKK